MPSRYIQDRYLLLYFRDIQKGKENHTYPIAIYNEEVCLHIRDIWEGKEHYVYTMVKYTEKVLVYFRDK